MTVIVLVAGLVLPLTGLTLLVVVARAWKARGMPPA
jgi:hypothetical protein